MVKDEDLCVALRTVRRTLPNGCMGYAEVDAVLLPYASDEAAGEQQDAAAPAA